MKRLAIAVVVAALAAPLLAGVSPKLKDWGSSPQSYFMTRVERAQWDTMTSDADAQAFIDKFVASRGGASWAAEVAKRAEMADKYLTVGKTPASQTLRGRAVIVFGPPSAVDVAAKPAPKGGRSGHTDAAYTAGEPTVGDVAEVSSRDAMSASASTARLYSLTFPAANMPSKKDLLVTFEVNANTGRDQVANKSAAAELENAFEQAAAASITAAK
jgi:hypothetical protein